jgi:hypothetical protein
MELKALGEELGRASGPRCRSALFRSKQSILRGNERRSRDRMVRIRDVGEVRCVLARGRERQVASVTLFLFIFAGASTGARRRAD